jgi:hypothetical protein
MTISFVRKLLSRTIIKRKKSLHYLYHLEWRIYLFYFNDLKVFIKSIRGETTYYVKINILEKEIKY